MKNISIIGSTGSIGTQALDVVREGDFAVCALAAGRNAALLEQQARAVRPQYAVLADEKEAKKLKTALADTSVRVMGGEDAVCAAAALEQADLILNAAVGIAGLRPTLAAGSGQQGVFGVWRRAGHGPCQSTGNGNPAC